MVISVKRMNSSFSLVSFHKIVNAMVVVVDLPCTILKSTGFHLAILKLVPFLYCLLKRGRESSRHDHIKYLDGLPLANTELYVIMRGTF